jgi:hypothetical protein
MNVDARWLAIIHEFEHVRPSKLDREHYTFLTGLSFPPKTLSNGAPRLPTETFRARIGRFFRSKGAWNRYP